MIYFNEYFIYFQITNDAARGTSMTQHDVLFRIWNVFLWRERIELWLRQLWILQQRTSGMYLPVYGLAIPAYRWVVNFTHDDVIKWKHFPRYWPFVGGIHRSPVNSPHKGQWRGALMFSLICDWINDWINNRQAGDLRSYPAHLMLFHCDVVISSPPTPQPLCKRSPPLTVESR